MGLLRCLSPGPSSLKESEMKTELRQVKAQLAAAKITIADLKQGTCCESRIGTGVAPAMTSVAVQAKPPVECESRIPRPDETAPLKPSAAGAGSKFSSPRVSVNDASVGTSAAGNTVPVSPGALKSPTAAVSSPKAVMGSPSRSMFRSRIPPSPSPDAAAMRRTHSARQSAPAAPPSTAALTTAAAGADAAEDAAWAPRPMTTSEAGACAAGALAESSHQARADLLANQLKVAEAFRQSLEAELRDLRFKAAGLQTQVLTLQTKLERSVEAQVDELNQIEKLRKGAGSTDSRGYEEALAQLAMLKKKLETSEADRIVAEHQAKAATELATSHHEALAATQAEVSSLKSDLGTAQAKLLELTAEGATLKQQVIKLGRAQARADELEAALAAAKAAAAASEAEYKDTVSKLEEELYTQKAISESTCEELLALSASHSDLKQAYFKLEAESKQHDQLVHIVQQELAEMSYFAAAGRVALGLCHPDEAQFTTGAVVVTPTHSGTVSAQAFTQQQSQPAATAATEAPSGGDGAHGGAANSNDKASGSSISRHNSRLIEDTTAVCIAAAAAAGAAAAVGATPHSPRSISSSRAATPRRMSKPAADLLATQAAAPTAAAAKEATLTAAGDSCAAEAVEAAVLAAAVAAAMVTLDAGEKAAQACDSTSTTPEKQQQPADLDDSAMLAPIGECAGDITAANSATQLSEVASITLSEGVGVDKGCAELAGQQGAVDAGGEQAMSGGKQGSKERRRRRRAAHRRKEQEGAEA